MSVSFACAKAVARATTWGLRRVFHRTGGALPGKLACRIDPQLLAHLTPNMSDGSVCVVATNGKTTVTNLLADILIADGRTVLCNRGGANMTQGIASVLLQEPPAQWGVFETDELYLAKVLPQLRSKYVLVMDIFPDQEDRMGSTGRLVESIAGALRACPDTTLVYNLDEPNCRAIAAQVSNRCVGVSAAGVFVEEAAGEGEAKAAKPTLASDVADVACPVCGEPLVYAWRQYGPLGDYACPACGFARAMAPAPDACIRDARVGTDAASWTLAFAGEAAADDDATDAWSLTAPYGAAYMVYNLSFAATASRLIGVGRDAVQRAITAFDPMNGRMERLRIAGRETLVNLAKNPVGLNQNLRLIVRHPEPCVAGFFLNKNVGDGLDSSWIGKVDFEVLCPRVADGTMRVFVGGMCQQELLDAFAARDVAVTPVDSASPVIAAADDLPADGRIWLIANYTALPDVKAAAEAAAKAGR